MNTDFMGTHANKSMNQLAYASLRPLVMLSVRMMSGVE
jgi:hypothetical protein